MALTSANESFSKGMALAAHACLLITMFFTLGSWLLLAMIPAIACVVLLYKAGGNLNRSHAAYARNTVIFMVLALVLATIALVVAITMVGMDDEAMGVIEDLTNKISSGAITPQEWLAGIIASEAVHKIGLGLGIALLLFLWPLKRTLQGVITAAISKPATGAGIVYSIIALVIAVLIVAVPLFVL
ncbi:MAG: hypothetical protein SPL30_00610 [Succinivibrio sp.]|nr:hypothetical protein [Succinivibrio sp.]